MRRIHPFAAGQVIGGLIVGVVAGAFLDWRAMVTAASMLAAGAAVSSLVCWWRPGLQASAWKLGLAALLANPLFLVALGHSIYDYECVLGWRRGWACFLSEVPPLAAGLSCLPPLFGLAWRRWRLGRDGLR
jgi:hypothetical protein